jgi:hypothetical protein
MFQKAEGSPVEEIHAAMPSDSGTNVTPDKPETDQAEEIRVELRRVLNCPGDKKVWITPDGTILNTPYCTGCVYQHLDDKEKPIEAPLDPLKLTIGTNQIIIVYCRNAPQGDINNELVNAPKQI